MKFKKLIISISILASASLLALLIGKSSKKSFNKVNRQAEIVILGGGCAGLTAANYLAMAGYKPIVLEGEVPGGLITQSHAVRNWPGEIEVSGHSLANKMKDQAQANGAIIFSEKVIDVDFSSSPYKIVSQNIYDKNKTNIREADSVIIAMGTRSNYLNIPGESGPNGYWGKGVTNCAVCDGSLYKDKTVAVIGGGDAAIVEASYLLNIVNKLYLIVRRDELRAYDKRKNEVLSNPKTVVLFNTSAQEIIGDGQNVKGIKLINNKTHQKSSIDVDGVFLAIGSKPNSEIFKNKLQLDKEGYIITSKNYNTGKEGVFAVGDVVDKVYKQAVTACGSGAAAALEVKDYLENEGFITTEAPTPKSIIKTELAEKPIEKTIEKGSIIEINSADQLEKEINNSKTPLILDFYATWCGPCKMMHPIIEEVSNKFIEKVKFIKINIDKVPAAAQKYHISGIPTFLFLSKEGKIIKTLVGYKPQEIIEDNTNKLIQ